MKKKQQSSETVCLEPIVFGFILRYFWAFVPLFDRTAEELDRGGRERGNDMQQRVAGWNRTRGHYGKDTASVYGTPTLLTELPGQS